MKLQEESRNSQQTYSKQMCALNRLLYFCVLQGMFVCHISLKWQKKKVKLFYMYFQYYLPQWVIRSREKIEENHAWCHSLNLLHFGTFVKKIKANNTGETSAIQ